MKLRKDTIEVTGEVEREAVQAVRKLVEESRGVDLLVPSETHFANLIVKTNERIDNVTSGKALSISWLARVAVPGVVAILFFFIGLHYYVPQQQSSKHEIADAVKALRAEDLDSLLANSSSDNFAATAELHPDLFDVSSDQLAEFYIVSGNPALVLEALPEKQVDEVASILESRSINL